MPRWGNLSALTRGQGKPGLMRFCVYRFLEVRVARDMLDGISGSGPNTMIPAQNSLGFEKGHSTSCSAPTMANLQNFLILSDFSSTRLPNQPIRSFLSEHAPDFATAHREDFIANDYNDLVTLVPLSVIPFHETTMVCTESLATCPDPTLERRTRFCM